MEKVKSEVTPSQKIQTINHQAWRTPSFQILQALSFVIMDILQDHVKMGIIELCHGQYCNLLYQVKKSKKGK